MKKKFFFLVNIDSFLVSHRLQIAKSLLLKGYEVHIATEYTKYKGKLKKMGFHTHNIKFNRNSMNLISMIISLAQIYILFKKIKPNIVHLISLKPIFLGGLLSFFSPIKSVVISITGLGSMFLGKGFLFRFRIIIINLIYRIIFLYPDQKVILQNDYDKNYLIKYTNLKKQKVQIIRGSGVNLKKFKFSNISFKKTPIILMASRLIGDKGVYEYIDAIKYLKKKNFKGKFYLVGDIDYANPSRIQKSKINIWKKKKLIFFLKHQEKISKLIKRSTLVVLPSYREGFPKILMEAAACGRPVVATNVPGCKDAVIKNITGILIPPKNYLALADAIKNLCFDHNKLLTMSLSARKHAIKNFDVKNIVTKHLSIYKKLLK